LRTPDDASAKTPRHSIITASSTTSTSSRRSGVQGRSRHPAVVAPTGTAALNVDGYTIHRLFGFRTTTTLDDVRGGAYRPGRFAKTLASLQTLILDEASMVRADVFDMVAAALSRFGPRPGAPFAGVQIVRALTTSEAPRSPRFRDKGGGLATGFQSQANISSWRRCDAVRTNSGLLDRGKTSADSHCAVRALVAMPIFTPRS
jgi:ATP-dependent DNA helicase PIF1